MPTLIDCRYNALVAQGFTGATSDMIPLWLQANGGVGACTSDLWNSMLISQGYTGANTDMWYAMLGDLGFVGSMNDREMAFWCGGGAITPPIFDGGLFSNGGFDGTLAPWLSVPLDQFDLSVDGDNAESFDVAGVGGAELVQDIALVAGESYTMSGVNIADSGVKAVWFFEETVQADIFDNPATFTATVTGTFPCGIHTPEGCGLSFDDMRMVSNGAPPSDNLWIYGDGSGVESVPYAPLIGSASGNVIPEGTIVHVTGTATTDETLLMEIYGDSANISGPDVNEFLIAETADNMLFKAGGTVPVTWDIFGMSVVVADNLWTLGDVAGTEASTYSEFANSGMPLPLIGDKYQVVINRIANSHEFEMKIGGTTKKIPPGVGVFTVVVEIFGSPSAQLALQSLSGVPLVYDLQNIQVVLIESGAVTYNGETVTHNGVTVAHNG